jgi:hypothetical protein
MTSRLWPLAATGIAGVLAPHVLVFCSGFLEGIVTLDQFEKLYCDTVSRFVDDPAITTPNGRNEATVFRLDRGSVRRLGREATLIGLGHPSKYAGRAEWRQVVARALRAVAAV